MSDDVTIEPATADDRLDVLRVFDAAMLSVDVDGLDERIHADDVLVARSDRTEAVVGALVVTRPEPTRRHVDAVAVRRERRARGIGSALVATAVRHAERDPAVDRVSAAFDRSLEAFYGDLGFDVTAEPPRERSERLTSGELNDGEYIGDDRIGDSRIGDDRAGDDRTDDRTGDDRTADDGRLWGVRRVSTRADP
ncbi:GNAT family N-acetyltransferase [Halorubrum sp. DTA98]|uniref:GNAT family N-acetyltransferase n=1 Tax=Halorubrum sp. DTA98 TaxID=3402163 RepID=UPI003AABEEFA